MNSEQGRLKFMFSMPKDHLVMLVNHIDSWSPFQDICIQLSLCDTPRYHFSRSWIIVLLLVKESLQIDSGGNGY